MRINREFRIIGLGLVFALASCASSAHSERIAADTSPLSPSVAQAGDQVSTTSPGSSATSDVEDGTGQVTSSPDTGRQSPGNQGTGKPGPGNSNSTGSGGNGNGSSSTSGPTDTQPVNPTPPAPPELPPHAFAVKANGYEVAEKSCSESCTIPLHYANAYTLDVSSKAGIAVSILDPTSCLKSGKLQLERAGLTCTVELSAPATNAYRKTTIQVTFKSEAHGTFNWTASFNKSQVVEGEEVTLQVQIKQSGTIEGGLNISVSGGFTTAPIDYIKQGPWSTVLRAGPCSTPKGTVDFRYSNSGVSLTAASGSPGLSIDIVCKSTTTSTSASAAGGTKSDTGTTGQ